MDVLDFSEDEDEVFLENMIDEVHDVTCQVLVEEDHHEVSNKGVWERNIAQDGWKQWMERYGPPLVRRLPTTQVIMNK